MSMPTASIAPQPSSPKKPEEWPYAFAHSGNRIRVAQLETSTVAAATAVTAVVVEKGVLRLSAKHAVSIAKVLEVECDAIEELRRAVRADSTS